MLSLARDLLIVSLIFLPYSHQLEIDSKLLNGNWGFGTYTKAPYYPRKRSSAAVTIDKQQGIIYMQGGVTGTSEFLFFDLSKSDSI